MHILKNSVFSFNIGDKTWEIKVLINSGIFQLNVIKIITDCIGFTLWSHNQEAN